MKNQRGVALILAIGTIAVLAVIATTFAFNMRLEYKIAVNYYGSVQARYVAEAALQKTIAELKEHVKSNAFTAPGGSSCTVGGSHSASATITDTQGRININTCSPDVLQNLIDVLRDNVGMGSLMRGAAAAIIASRPYLNLQDIIMRTRLDRPRAELLMLLMPFITTHSSGGTSININTAAQPVIAAVLIDSAGLGRNTAWDVAGDLEGSGLTSWHEFNSTIDGLIQTASNPSGYITASQASDIKDGCNPNRSSGGTKFRFHPGGYYTITATGETEDGGGKATLTAVIKISDNYIITTQDEFEDEKDDSNTWGVTLSGSCPVDSREVFGQYGISDTPDDSDDEITTIPGSIKLGYWNASESTGLGDKYYILDDNGIPVDWMDFSLRADAHDLDATDQMKKVATVTIRDDLGARHTKIGPLEWGGSRYAYLFNPASPYGDVIFWTDADAIDAGRNPADDKCQYSPGQVRLFTYDVADEAIRDPNENNDSVDYGPHLGYETSKTFNISAIGNSITVTVYTDGDNRATLTRDLSGLSAEPLGDIYFSGDSTSVAWDDIRIIPPSGVYHSKDIEPTGDRVEWGTISATITYPDESSCPVEVRSYPSYDDTPPSYCPLGSGGYAILSESGSTSDDNYKTDDIVFDIRLNSDAGMQETPVVEDIIITYLPTTRIESYAFTSD